MAARSVIDRILVTGAQGFVGRYMVRELLRVTSSLIMGIGRSPFSAGAFTHEASIGGKRRPAPLTRDLQEAAEDRRYFYRTAEITNLNRLVDLIADFCPSKVIHLASARREETVERLITGNVLGISTLVHACQLTNSVKRIVVASSAGVYGVPAHLPLTESMLCRPIEPYGASKLAAEDFARVLCDRAGIELVIGRIFNIVGPGQEERHVCGRLANEVAAMRHTDRAPRISVTGLSATRDYVDVRDVAAALRLLADLGAPNEIYNIASGIETSVAAILQNLLTLAGLAGKVEVEERPAKPNDIARHVGNVAKLAALGHDNSFKLIASLNGVLNYYAS